MGGMMSVTKYHGGDFSGIHKTIYKLKWPKRLYYKLWHKKTVTHSVSVFYETSQLREFIEELDRHNLFAIHTYNKRYKVMKANILMTEVNHTAFILMA